MNNDGGEGDQDGHSDCQEGLARLLLLLKDAPLHHIGSLLNVVLLGPLMALRTTRQIYIPSHRLIKNGEQFCYFLGSPIKATKFPHLKMIFVLLIFHCWGKIPTKKLPHFRK